MINLIISDQSLSINHQGFIVQWSELSSISKDHYIYPVVFKVYSRENPFCRTLDVNSSITVLEQTANTLTFTKQIEYIEFHFVIKLQNDKLEYQMEAKSWPIDYEFGITIPVVTQKPWMSIDDDPNLAFSVYSPFFHEDFADQTFLDKPLLFDSDVCIFGELDKKYRQNQTQLH